MRSLWSWIFSGPRRSRRLVVALCFLFGLAAGWAIGSYLLR